MRTIDALLKDGRSALFDLEGASPGGGQVTSEPAYGPQITPGDVVSYCGAWTAVTEASHNGILGLTRLAMIDAAGAVTRHTMLASGVIARRTDARIDPGSLYKLADQSAAYRYLSTAPGTTAGAVDDQQLIAWIEDKHSTSLDEGTITGLHDLRHLARVAVAVLDEHSATHPIRDIAVWTLDDGTGEALITVDHRAGIRLASFTLRPQALSGRTFREALAELLAIARALTGRLDALVASTAHLWTHATGAGPRQGDPADRTADAKLVLFDLILAATPPVQRDQAEGWLTDLLYLAEDDLTRDGREELIREVLGEAGPAQGAERDYEVAGEPRTVRARSPQEAVALALREEAEETDDRHYQPDPNPRLHVRPAHSQGPWQLVYAYEAPELPPDEDKDGPLPDTPTEIDGMLVRAAFPTPPEDDDCLEHWTVLLRETSGPGGGTYRVCRVRRAGAPGEWEVFDGMPGAQGLTWMLAAEWYALAVQVEADSAEPPLQEDRHLPR